VEITPNGKRSVEVTSRWEKLKNKGETRDRRREWKTEAQKKKNIFFRELHALKTWFIVGGEDRNVRLFPSLTVAGESGFRMMTPNVSSEV